MNVDAVDRRARGGERIQNVYSNMFLRKYNYKGAAQEMTQSQNKKEKYLITQVFEDSRF